MKKILPLLAITVLAGSAMWVGKMSAVPAASAFKPTWSGDNHDIPVYTSPTNDAPAVNKWAHTNAIPKVPGMTNWPLTNLPPTTNWPTTNLPAMTNPPALQPPGGK